jgi:hypothetical protein
MMMPMTQMMMMSHHGGVMMGMGGMQNIMMSAGIMGMGGGMMPMGGMGMGMGEPSSMMGMGMGMGGMAMGGHGMMMGMMPGMHWYNNNPQMMPTVPSSSADATTKTTAAAGLGASFPGHNIPPDHPQSLHLHSLEVSAALQQQGGIVAPGSFAPVKVENTNRDEVSEAGSPRESQPSSLDDSDMPITVIKAGVAKDRPEEEDVIKKRSAEEAGSPLDAMVQEENKRSKFLNPATT